MDILETIIVYDGLWKNYPVWFLMTLFMCRFMANVFSKRECCIIVILSMLCCSLGLNANLPAFWLFTVLSAWPFLQ